MDLKELKALLAKNAQRLKELVSQRTWTDKEQKEKRTLLTECEGLKTDIEQLEEEQRMVSELDKSFVDPPSGFIGVLPGQTTTRQSVNSGMAENRTFAGMFPDEERSSEGFKDSEEFLNVVLSGRHDERLTRAKIDKSEKRNNIGVGTEGGFSVPTEFSSKWLDSSLQSEIVRSLAQSWPMSSSERLIPGFSGKDHSGGTVFGGLKMEWLEEKGTGTKQKPKMELLTLKARKGAIFAQISNELKEDGMGFAQQLELALKSTVGFGLDSAFINGNGAGKPAGVLSSANPALLVVDKGSGQGAGTLIYANLTSMYGRLAPGSYKNAIWLANQDVMQQLLALVVVTGTDTGDHVPVLKETNGSFSIFGRPVVFTEHAASLGAQGDISLIDFSQYAVGLRKEMSLDISIGSGWTEDATDYRIITRVDGMSTWSAPITPLNGNNTLSPFITLEERT